MFYRTSSPSGPTPLLHVCPLGSRKPQVGTKGFRYILKGLISLTIDLFIRPSVWPFIYPTRRSEASPLGLISALQYLIRSLKGLSQALGSQSQVLEA